MPRRARDGRAVDGRSGEARLDTRCLVTEQGVDGPISSDGPRAVPRCDQRDPARHARDRVTHQRNPRCTGRPGSTAAHGARTSARADPGKLRSR